ncbi:MAG: GGDEF domain-containing protein [Gammaproteobacteria bacterium]|nr:GGDEF domain-containing protein [Gammaproteobacteria bacterium]
MKQTRIDRTLDIEQAQLRGFARSVSEIEWLLLFLVILYLFATRPDLAHEPPLLGILIGFALFVLAFRYARPLASRPWLKIVAEIFAMVLFATGVLVYTGGDKSPLLNLYLLPIVTAALVLGKRAVAVVMVLVGACYLLLAMHARGLDALEPRLAIETLGVLAPFILVAFSTTLLAENINASKERIRALSDRDELTSLYNRAAFMRLAEREHTRAARNGRPYSLLMIDVRQLKSINETYGHEAGNRAVKLVSDALERLTRSTDLVARYGGDEFVVLLTEADRTVAEEVAQRIRNVVFSTTLEVDATMVRVKVSVGVASFPDDGTALAPILAAADRSMQKDKHDREPPKGVIVIRRR